jgi:DNA polymerase-3 subunit delta
MRLRSAELEAHLTKGLAPLYLLTGDEPLQLGEAADRIRHRARSLDYATREVMEVDRGFDWNELAAEANSLSLFSEKRIIDLRIPSGKPEAAGGKALQAYVERPPEDTLLLITMPKLEKNQTNSAWFKALERAGVVIQIWPVDGAQLVPWLERRMRERGLQPQPGVGALLADQIEGNLLAAAQEIDKLLLLHGPGPLSAEQLLAAVSDSARFDVFKLVDSALAGQAARSLRILGGLRGEGTATPVVLWALAREIRMLAELAWEVEHGTSVQRAIAARPGLWDNRKPLVGKALQRTPVRGWHQLLRLCTRTDRAIKGRERADPWLLLEQITLRLAGAQIIR